jgi:NAD dependent epimerase/dehydratase family enzyme
MGTLKFCAAASVTRRKKFYNIATRIHVKDLAELIKFSIEDDKVSGVLNGVAPQLISNKVH